MISPRWLIRRDLPEVMAIERENFGEPWSEEMFLSILARGNVIAMVLEDEDEAVVAYFVYEFHKRRINLLNLAVRKDRHRTGLGRKAIEKLISKLSPDRRCRIVATVSDWNTPAHFFFRSLGFKAVRTLRNHFDNGEDAYEFRFTLGADHGQVAVASQVSAAKCSAALANQSGGNQEVSGECRASGTGSGKNGRAGKAPG